MRRHLDTPWLQPLHRPSVVAYALLRSRNLLTKDKSFILDSGCGTGNSTRYLAARHPGQLVIGVDRSRVRLGRSGMADPSVVDGLMQHHNCVLVRAELATFWRLLVRDGLAPDKHFLLYPNPWPKVAHLKRRWHGHPVFPSLLALGGEIEMRCNWEVYAMEFARAASLATGQSIVAKPYRSQEGISPFERKYMQRRQKLFAVTVPQDVLAAFRSFVTAGQPAL